MQLDLATHQKYRQAPEIRLSTSYLTISLHLKTHHRRLTISLCNKIIHLLFLTTIVLEDNEQQEADSFRFIQIDHCIEIFRLTHLHKKVH